MLCFALPQCIMGKAISKCNAIGLYWTNTRPLSCGSNVMYPMSPMTANELSFYIQSVTRLNYLPASIWRGGIQDGRTQSVLLFISCTLLTISICIEDLRGFCIHVNYNAQKKRTKEKMNFGTLSLWRVTAPESRSENSMFR